MTTVEMTGSPAHEAARAPEPAAADATREARMAQAGKPIEAPPPVFLLGSHKSGSSLLRSLLDGHPQLAVLPKETHLFQFTNHWVDYRRRRNVPQPLDRGQLIDGLIEHIRNDTRGDDPYADAPGFAYRMDVLEPRLRALDPADMPAFFRGYMQAAYEAGAGRPPTPGTVLVEKSVEHAEFAYVLARYFPGARFVHIVRNPYATLVAVRRMLQKKSGRFPYLWPMAASLYNSYHHLFTNRLALPNYLCIRFEDLVQDTRASMERIAGFLGVDYLDLLTRPTSLGERWQGNSTTNEAFHGISQRPLEEWKGRITDYEIAVGNLIAEPVLDAFGYERLQAAHPYRRVKGERPKTYAANRAALLLGI
jgi:hypothetical protein